MLASISHKELHKTSGHAQKAFSTKVGSPIVKLTEEEKSWILSHPKIVVGAETDSPPFDFVVNDKAEGFANVADAVGQG